MVNHPNRSRFGRGAAKRRLSELEAAITALREDLQAASLGDEPNEWPHVAEAAARDLAVASACIREIRNRLDA